MGIFSRTILNTKAKRVAQYKEFTTFNAIFSTPQVKELIIRLNTEEQLYKGVNAKGEQLSDIGGDYAFITKDLKDRAGVPYDRVTLKDTGDFYDSWRIYVVSGNIYITADTIKDGVDLQQRWGSDILGLTNESKGVLINVAKDKYIQNLRKLWRIS